MRAAAVFALSAGVIVPAVVHAPAAHADWTAVQGTTEDDGRYTVTLPSTALWVKVSVLASTAADAAVLASTEEVEPKGSWLTTKAPLTLPEGTALGSYPIRVDYRLPGETTKQWTAGTYDHLPHIGVGNLSYDRSSTDWDHRKAVLTGTTTLWNPATGERTTAPEGTKVQVSLPIENITTRTVTAFATVGADGTFSLPVTPNGTVTGGTAKIVGTTPGLDPDDAASLPWLPADATLKYRITTNISKYRVLAGTDVRVSGRVERLTPAGWKPFAGVPVVATSREPQYENTASNVIGGNNTAANGTFSFNARPTYATADIFTSLRPSPYFAGTPRPYDKSDIVVPQQFSYGAYKMSLDAYGKVTATGRLGSGNTYCERTQPVALQVSRDGGRTWGTLRSGTTDNYCAYTLSAWGYTTALYRVHHTETDRFVAKTGSAVRLARSETRFSAFTISPTRPTVNGKMTVSGTVQRKVNGVWKPLPGVKLTLLFKPKGENTWYWVTKSISTNSSGKFSYRATAYEDGSWATVLQPPAGYFYSETKAKYIDAR
ncbi:hypothetical protein OG259_19045 [Streptomyces sp. NBC_00250]|uniref:hypothetical protein n=1 Tax=Streptomyces sp. NBC_00250 TaxID=2903641 RepID=UPI002E29FA1C|nr:hypothetical protein [Streptomyces sp. NBC_00250]